MQLLAAITLPLVLADAAAAAVLTVHCLRCRLCSQMLAAAAALLADAALPSVLAEAAAAALLALAARPPVRARHGL